MIYTETDKIGQYHGMGKYLDKAFDYLADHFSEDVEPGYYGIDGKCLYMNVLDYETIREEEAFFEAHALYADIHIVVSGEELVGVSDMSRVKVKTFNEEGDLYEVEGTVEHYIRLVPGKALIVLPGDAHKLKLTMDQPSTVRKAVIKVFIGRDEV